MKVVITLTKSQAHELESILDDAVGYIDGEPTPEPEDEESKRLRLEACNELHELLLVAIINPEVPSVRLECKNGLNLRPHFEDACEHDPKDFLGTVIENGAPIDVYAYQNRHGLVETCCRFGNEPSEYRSGEGASVGGFRLWSDRPSHWLIASWLVENRLRPLFVDGLAIV